MTEIKKIKNYFNPFQTVSIAPLVVFRIIFGTLMFLGIIRFISKGWVTDLYITPDFYFGYLGFEWVKPLQGNLMFLPFILLLISAIGIVLGAYYRVCTILFFTCFTYIELLDKSNYLNHYYFISLISFLFIFVPANAFLSLDVRWRRVKEQSQIPLWNIGMFKIQLAFVYIFAGIAKLEADWLLHAQPLKLWLQAHRDMPFFGKLLMKEWVAYVFSWFGCVYDLFIVFFLLNKRFRPFAYVLVVIFHFVTWYLLPIGIFPWVMIFSTLIFFSVNFHEKIIFILSKLIRTNVNFSPISNPDFFAKKKWVSFLIGTYILFQVTVPFRYLLYPGNLFWSEEGFRFSWRVMLMHKEGTATFYVRDRKSGGEIEVENCRYLTNTQSDQMSTQPDMILQYAQFLKRKFSDTLLIYGNQKIHLTNPSIHSSIFVSLNGRPSKIFVSKKHDLTQIPYNFAPRKWLEPFSK